MDFWKSAREAAERAALAAKSVSQRGMEYAEGAAEEASRKIKEMHIYERVQQHVNAGIAIKPPSADELAFFGVSGPLCELVRSLDETRFREFPDDQLVSLAPGAEPKEDAALNKWQVRHGVLICSAVQELTDVRFKLCPKEMTDNHFWHVYFSIVKSHLPDVAFSWGQETLPVFDTTPEGQLAAQQAIANISTQLKDLGSRIQQAAAANQHRIALPSIPALEAFRGFGMQSSDAPADGAEAAKAAGEPSAEKQEATKLAKKDIKVEEPAAATGNDKAPVKKGERAAEEEEPVLEADPDLEAYLQVAISERDGEGGDAADDINDDDIDFDSYLDELTAEVEAKDAKTDSPSDEAKNEEAKANEAKDEEAKVDEAKNEEAKADEAKETSSHEA